MSSSKPRVWVVSALIATLAVSSGSAAGENGQLSVTVDALDAGGRFQDRAAFCLPSGSAGEDVSPGVRWSAGPKATRSYALLMTDPDVPADLSLVNKPGVVISKAATRVRVFHWVLADIPPTLSAIPGGAEGQKLVPGGKPVGPTPHGLRGANVFTTFLAGVKGMAGTYGGYDGPCPPTNDQRTHRYNIRVLALDVASLGLSGPFTGDDVERTMAGHVLAEGQVTATYGLNGEVAQ